MSHDERDAIARLELFDEHDQHVRSDSGEPIWGTAFLTGRRCALTAYHVVADRAAEGFALKAHSLKMIFTRAGGVTVAVRASELLADRDLDVVLLELEEDLPVALEPLVSSADVAPNAAFSAWGFAGVNPRDGIEFSGKVADVSATVAGQPALQLYSYQAAAAHARVAGLSGGPCCVDGRVVGVVRSYIEQEGSAVAGTIYATPLAEVLALPAFAERIRVDPCAELPSLPDAYPWPDEPYRDLLPFGSADARVFFGRCSELSRLRRAIEDPTSRIVLLYGQTGVGKSSLLHAGLTPRLARAWDVRYARRDPALGSVQTFEKLCAAARDARPWILVLDQVEEAVTRPLGDAVQELSDLAFALTRHLAENPGDRVVLGFRKEWLAEIERALSTHAVAKLSVPLQPMGPAAVEEVVLGLERSPRMKERYRVEVEREVAAQIARVLCTDRQSAIAPALQILLTKLWKAAGERSKSPRVISAALFESIARDGLGLGAVLDQRLAHLSKGAGARSLGLVLDLLRLHVTKAGTSALVKRAQRAEVYGTRANEAEAVVRELVSEYLLVDARDDGQDAEGDTALAHDALGPLVLARFAASELPGQRARRILENRSDSAALDAHDLGVVERGLPAMRVPTKAEQDLIDASRARRRRERLTRRGLVVAFAVLAIVAAIGGIRSYLSTVDLAKEVHARALSQAALVFVDGLRIEDERGEPLGALRKIARAVALAPNDDPRLSEYITKLVHTTASGPSIVTMVPAETEILAASYANGRLAVITLENVVRVFRVQDQGPVRGMQVVELGRTSLPKEHELYLSTLALDPSGQRVLIGGRPHGVLLEVDATAGLRRSDLATTRFVHFGADGESVIEADKRGRRVVVAGTPASAAEAGADAPWIPGEGNVEEPTPTLRVRAQRPYLLRAATRDKGRWKGWQVVDAASNGIRDELTPDGVGHRFGRISSDARVAITWSGGLGGGGLVRWELATRRSKAIVGGSVFDAFLDPTGDAVIASAQDDSSMTGEGGVAMLAPTMLWTPGANTPLPGCSHEHEVDWVRWIDDKGNLLCRASNGWVRAGAWGHTGFALGTEAQSKRHLHDGMLDRSPLLQVIDSASKRLLELWPSGELRAWSLSGPHGTSLLGERAQIAARTALEDELPTRDGRMHLRGYEDVFVVDHKSGQDLLRLGKAEEPDAKVFKSLFARARAGSVKQAQGASAPMIELTRAEHELPARAWKLDAHTMISVGGSDIAPPSSTDYDDFVISGDGRFGAAIADHDPSVRLWRNRAFLRTDGVTVGPKQSYWLAPRERLPGAIVAADFHVRDGALWLRTALADGTQREHFVSEDFAERPAWTTELPWLLGGAIGDNDVTQVRPGMSDPEARRQAFGAFALDGSQAARVLRHGFFEAP